MIEITSDHDQFCSAVFRGPSLKYFGRVKHMLNAMNNHGAVHTNYVNQALYAK